jgi:hypothetical protein
VRKPTSGLSVTRKADSKGHVSFAGRTGMGLAVVIGCAA